MKVTLCIPMYNESSIIKGTLETVSAYMRENFEDYEVLFADDGSTDGCGDTVDAFPDEHIRRVGYEKNRGKGAAVRCGVLASDGDVVIYTDCDLAYGLEVVKSAVKMLEDHPEADGVIGSRNLTDDGYEGYTPIRKLASKIYIKCIAAAAGFRLTDSQCGFKCFKSGVAKRIFSECTVDGFAFELEVLIKAAEMGVKILEMPVKIINHRESKVNVIKDSFKMLNDVRKIKKASRKK